MLSQSETFDNYFCSKIDRTVVVDCIAHDWGHMTYQKQRVFELHVNFVILLFLPTFIPDDFNFVVGVIG